MHQNHSWLVDGPDGSAFTLLSSPIVGDSVSTKDAMTKKTNLKAMVKSTSASPDDVRQFAVTHVHQLYAGEHGTTRVVVACRIEEGIDNAKEAKSDACVLGVGASVWGKTTLPYYRLTPLCPPPLPPLPTSLSQR